MVEHKLVPVYAYEPTGAWSDLLHTLPTLTDLFSVYESVLLCESIVVISKSPQLCSEFISAIVDLTRPVPYAGDIRPYMTMQSDFQSIGLDGGIPRPFIVGITNPFLLRRITEAMQSRDRGQPHVVLLDPTTAEIPIKRHHSQFGRSPTTFEFPGSSGPYPIRKPHIKSDREFIETLRTTMAQHSAVQHNDLTSIVRRHFAELTGQFLSPLNRYLATSVSPSVTTPGGNFRYANFSQADFLTSLSKYGTAVKFKGQNGIQRHKARDVVYGKFCESLNWHSWLDMKICLEKEASAGLLSTSSTASHSD